MNVLLYSKCIRKNQSSFPILRYNSTYFHHQLNSNVLGKKDSNIGKRFQTNSSLANDFEIQKIPPGAGAIWISDIYEYGSLMILRKLWYKVRGKEKEFQQKIYNQINQGFDRITFPHIRQIIPEFKEKGCYITFATREQAKQSMSLLSKGVKINERMCYAYLVQGTPFIEDLKLKPSVFLKITLSSNTEHFKLNTEMLFSELRQYGKIDSINVDEKLLSATIKFSNTNSSIAAKNCIHWKPIGDTQFTVRYVPFSRLLQLLEIVRNPRVYIPLLGILITLSLFLLVDPVRLASVTQQFTRGFQDEELRQGKAAEEDEPNMRDEFLEKLNQNFRTMPTGNIYIVTGPPGSGKSYLFKKLLHNRSLSVYFDCKMDSVQEFSEALGKTIAFSPSFNAILTVVGWLESIIPGLKKSALSPSTQTQVESILRSLGNAISLISAGIPNVQGISFPVVAFDGFHEMLERLSRSDEQTAKMLLDILITWTVHTAKHAHIVFIGQNPFGEDTLRMHPALRKRKVVSIQIKDLDNNQALKYLKHHLPNISDERLMKVVDITGGRQIDLQSLVSHVRTGLTPEESIQRMIILSENIIRLGFGNQMLGSSQKKWSQYQLWRSIKLISGDSEGCVSYDKLLFFAFNGNVEALKALVAAKILTVENIDGNLIAKAYSPLYLHAFRKLHKTPGISRGLDRLECKEDIEKLMDDLKRYEEELKTLKAGESYENKQSIKQRREVIAEKIIYVSQKLAKKEAQLREIEDRPYE